MTAKDIESVIDLSDTIKDFLNSTAKAFDLSARSYNRILTISRTIADLEGHDEIEKDDLMEAIQYRPKIHD